jgi:single-strand DNA-binding protein
MNNITIVGRLGGDPEVRIEQDGRTRTSFSIADDQGKDKDKNDRTNWFRCTAWGKTAENIGNYFGKGSTIAVSGQMFAREYTGNDGKNRTSLDVVVSHFGFCGDAKKDDQQPAPQQSAPAPAAAPQYGPPAGPPVGGPPTQPQLPAPPLGYQWVNTANGPAMVPIVPQEGLPF